MRIIITLNNKVVSLRSPEGNNNILDINAAKVEYAKQLNHLYILDFSFIISDVNTPKNHDIYVDSDVINVTPENLANVDSGDIPGQGSSPAGTGTTLGVFAVTSIWSSTP